MNHAPSLHGIEERLSRALRQFLVLPSGINEQVIGVPLSSRQLERVVKNILARKNEWLAAVPAFQDVQNWIEVHWDTERQTQPPADTVSTGDGGNQGEIQLDALTATCKLILAARDHGVETVAKHAIKFAAHGMIEVSSFYMVKGSSISSAKSLGDYCTLLPYQDALQIVNTESSIRSSSEDLLWPIENTGNLCAFEVRSFEHRGFKANEFERYIGPLLRCGVETMQLILGLVWGKGVHIFGHWHGVRMPVAATLPYFHADSSEGRGSSQVLLPLLNFQRVSTNRPFNEAEAIELIGKYGVLPRQTRRVLNLTLRRLQDSVERIEIEDKVIDVCIALETMFLENGEDWDQKKIVSRRASWHFADSLSEREQIRDALKTFYDHRSYIVHGYKLAKQKVPVDDNQRLEQLTTLLADVENVVRTSLKTMIAEGRPQDWEESKNPALIRHDPPRAETEIPSVKSDSLSWSLKEKKEIDQALEAVWKPTIDNAPAPPPDVSCVIYGGIYREQIERYKQEGTAYVIRTPAQLYIAHPKWPKNADDPLDERTKYYCTKDVERHLLRWEKAAAEKKLHQFVLQLDNATMYLPEHFDLWRKILPEELEQGKQP